MSKLYLKKQPHNGFWHYNVEFVNGNTRFEFWHIMYIMDSNRNKNLSFEFKNSRFKYEFTEKPTSQNQPQTGCHILKVTKNRVQKL